MLGLHMTLELSKKTQLYMESDWYFQEDEYLLADVAYPLSPTVIPCYKNAVGDQAEF